jgi:hypothetical protein
MTGDAIIVVLFMCGAVFVGAALLALVGWLGG